MYCDDTKAKNTIKRAGNAQRDAIAQQADTGYYLKPEKGECFVGTETIRRLTEASGMLYHEELPQHKQTSIRGHLDMCFMKTGVGCASYNTNYLLTKRLPKLTKRLRAIREFADAGHAEYAYELLAWTASFAVTVHHLRVRPWR
jgi:hypothetical protein